MTPGVAEIDLSALPAEVQERWPYAIERAQRKIQTTATNPAASRLLQASQRASSARQRVVWLHRTASAWAEPLQAVSACRTGCSHCCHIPVTITRVEADLIAQATGRKQVRPQRSVHLAQHDSLESAMAAHDALRDPAGVGPGPCPFLANGRCSVYAVRPMACRLLLNLDDDELLCRLVDGTPIPVPYADSRRLQALYLLAQPGAELADIRAFFP